MPPNLPVEAISISDDKTYTEEVKTKPDENIEPEKEVVEEQVPDILKRIAFCESGDRHFINGEVLRGKENPHDIGRYQINETYHNETAKEMGIDIYTEKGNEEYALWLYEEQGTDPWVWSKKCWNK